MNDDLPSGDNEVCPRCGRGTTGETFCAECGLNLASQRELPTADAYAAGVREKRWLQQRRREQEAAREAKVFERRDAATQRAAEKRKSSEKAKRERAAKRADSASQNHSRHPFVIVAVTVVVVVVAAAAVILTRDDTPRTTNSATTATTPNGKTAPATAATPGRQNEPAERVAFTDDNGKPLVEPDKLIFGKTTLDDLSWTGWGSEKARATGTLVAVDCEPSCAEGAVETSDAEITLTTIRQCGGERQYTEGVLTDEGGGPPNEIASSEADCAEASRESAAGGTNPSDEDERDACQRVTVTKGDVSCSRAVAVADAAIASGEGSPNETTRVRGFDCRVYPYAVECSDGAASAFEAKYGTAGAQRE